MRNNTLHQSVHWNVWNKIYNSVVYTARNNIWQDARNSVYDAIRNYVNSTVRETICFSTYSNIKMNIRNKT